MKPIIFICFAFLNLPLFAQDLLKDTLKIPQVTINEVKAKSSLNQQIDSAVLQQSISKNLGEVLASQANLFVKSYGLGSQATVSLRGSGSAHTNVFWNGIALNSSMNGIVDLALFPTHFLEEVSVDYGNQSLSSGSGGLGGAIQMNNQPSFGKKRKLHLEQQIGSFSFRNSEVGVEVGDDKWYTQTKLMLRSAKNNFEYENLGEEGFPTERIENADLDQKSFMQSLYFRPKEDLIIEGHVWFYDSKRNLPPLITLKNFQERQEDQSNRFLLGVKQYYKTGFISFKSSVLKDYLSYYNENRANEAITEIFNIRNVAEGEKEFKKTKLYGRLNVDIESAEHEAFVEEIHRERISLFASVEHALTQKWKVKAAARQEWVIEEASFLLPTLSITFTPTKNWNLFTQWSKNLKYPSLNDLYWEFGGNNDLEAEENRSVELGSSFKKEFREGRYAAEFRSTIYQSIISNYIQWQPTEFGYWQAVNLRDVEISGLESSLKVQQKNGTLGKSIFVSYTFTESLNQTKNHEFDESVDKQLIYIPKHQTVLNFSVDYKKYTLNYQWQYVDSRFTTSDNTEWQPDYQISNVTISRTFKGEKNRLKAEFSVLNVFDLEYQTIQWRPMPNRNYQFTLSYQLF